MDFGTNNNNSNNNNGDELQNFFFSSPLSTNSSRFKSFSPQNASEDTQLTLNPNNNINNVVPKEHMFDKVVTPSDVGKLNRLVIPKQHAEKYFPLDSSSTEKGLLLNFEDRIGKPWRFRYSYWNSSQSYVMTKGWSRFVKDKKLDAGDIVSFQRGIGEFYKDRLYIDWKRRLNVVPDISNSFSLHQRSGPWNPMFLRPLQNPMYNNFSNQNMGSIIYIRPGPAPLQNEVRMRQNERRVDEQTLVVHEKEATKTLRLFGVNMECGVSSESSSSLDPFSRQSRIQLQANELIKKGKSSSKMSLDLDI